MIKSHFSSNKGDLSKRFRCHIAHALEQAQHFYSQVTRSKQPKLSADFRLSAKLHSVSSTYVTSLQNVSTLFYILHAL